MSSYTEDSEYEDFVPRSKPSTRLLSMTDRASIREHVREPDCDTSSVNTEFVYHELSPRNYYNSSFPSLLSDLGPRARTKTKIKKKASSMPSRSKVDAFQTVNDEDMNKYISKQKMKDNMTFTEKMKRFNESRWLRIESVAQEKLNHYDKYVSDMNSKLKQQRKVIEKRAQQQLQDLGRLEERKREDMLFQSPFGRMWRHHRTMQRRAYSLEKLHPPNVQFSIQSPRSTRTML